MFTIEMDEDDDYDWLKNAQKCARARVQVLPWQSVAAAAIAAKAGSVCK